MCGRFNVNQLADVLVVLFGLDEAPEVPPRFNIAPTQAIAAVRENRDTHRQELCFLHWGLIPHWARDPTIGRRMINARAETAAEKPSFRSAMRYRRCLVPANGYYEWQKGPGGRQPYNIRLRESAPFAFAGLWEHWQGPGGEEIESCVILTTTATEGLRAIHDRMPLILPREAYASWLDSRQQRSNALLPLLRPYPGDDLIAVPVSPYVNDPRHDDPRCVEPVADADDGGGDSAS